MRRTRRHTRCPECQSLDTKRHGFRPIDGRTANGAVRRIRRFLCKSCGRTFSLHSSDHGATKMKAAELYFDAGASYRAVARQLGIHTMTAYAYVAALTGNSKSPWEMSIELQPHWCGFLVVDGDSLRVGKRMQTLLVGVDAATQDIPHAILAEHEDGENWTHFLLVARAPVAYPFRGIVSDGDPAIESAVRAVVPEIPHQLCVKHFEDQLSRFLRYSFTPRQGLCHEADRLLEIVHRLLYARSLQGAQRYLRAISVDPGFKAAGLQEATAKVEAAFSTLTTHHLYPGMPRTTSIAEGVISRLDSKINSTDGFEYPDTAWATLKMLIAWYRFKKFTDCRGRNRRNNGKSPLELAGVPAPDMHWINLTQKNE